MKKTPTICTCSNCECAIYTYEDIGVCKACQEGKHLSGAKKKDYESDSKENPELKI